MAEYRPTIGLEIHAELNTRTKMFCACLNDADEKRPNVNVCPVCMAHPGSLPVINKEAVRHVLRMGLALGSKLADYTEFDRKSYFYPDIPKGYQLSQFAFPLVSGGSLRNVQITRIHLEEDTARSQHEGDHSLIDYNRAGVPLMELVTEPVIHTAEDAGNFARELQLLLRYLGAGEANMEKGEMRVEANISVSRDDTLGTKVEVKNLNSFRSVERAIAYEVARHIEVLEKGGTLVQETRGWNENTQSTFSQRKKESSHDYRYFPDPDLPKLRLSEISELSAETLRASLPEIPSEKRERLTALGFLQSQDIEQLVGDAKLAALFGEMEKELDSPEMIKIAANFILNDIAGQLKKDASWAIPEAVFLSEVVRKYADGTMASPQAKQAILTGKIVAAIDNAALPVLVQKIIEAQPAVVADYKAGKAASLQFLVGQGMKESKGSANPAALAEEFKKALQ
ncbi:Asp-tRNA(Asn)/Glu-tRNA(Gln) amidotransferase subunit GatB [Patescibacteria group bacterium]|nr:Asp-tRNA(Asn)/Glu-tRNA(Gln) amidotransferase subunit GatB [Patescibacteria group bacterium]